MQIWLTVAPAKIAPGVQPGSGSCPRTRHAVDFVRWPSATAVRDGCLAAREYRSTGGWVDCGWEAAALAEVPGVLTLPSGLLGDVAVSCEAPHPPRTNAHKQIATTVARRMGMA